MAFETLHHMKMKKTGKVGHMALKLDMSKAYDKLEWIFLQRIMQKMGFHPTWVGWIMECIKSVSYSILVNGEPKGHKREGFVKEIPPPPIYFFYVQKG